MKFEITSQDDISCITLRGTLNALDMIFMIQSPEYQEAISANRKLLFDYTEVDDFKLTPEDVMGITLLGKKSLDSFSASHLAVIVNDDQKVTIQKISQAIFENTDTKIDVTDDKREAMKILQLGI